MYEREHNGYTFITTFKVLNEGDTSLIYLCQVQFPQSYLHFMQRSFKMNNYLYEKGRTQQIMFSFKSMSCIVLVYLTMYFCKIPIMSLAEQ